MSELPRPPLHYLDPARSWPLCGALPDVPAWTPVAAEVTCPDCLERLAALARGAQPPAAAGAGGR